MKRMLAVLLCTCFLMTLQLAVAPPAQMITKVSLSASQQNVNLCDDITWTAYDMDGSGNYRFHFMVYCDNAPYYIGDWDTWQTEPYLSLETTKTGTYYATVMVYDLGWDDYWEASSGFTLVSVGIGAPSSLHAEAVANEAAGTLKVSLSWTAVAGANGYGILRREAGGEDAYAVEMMYPTLSYTDELPLPDTGICLYYKVCGLVIVYDKDPRTFEGPYSELIPVTWGRWLHPIWEGLLYPHVWPWDETWHGPWLAWLMEAYGDPAKWPADTPPTPEAVAGLVEKLVSNEPLNELELAMCAAIHPDGLALLEGAYLNPPGEESAKLLAGGLSEACGILNNRLPEALSGTEAAKYSSLLKEQRSLLRIAGGQATAVPVSTPRVLRTPVRIPLATPTPTPRIIQWTTPVPRTQGP